MNEIEILASKSIEGEDFLEAKRLLEPLAANNSQYALMTLGWLYEIEKTTFRDMKLAESFYERATKIGCLEAFNCLGRVLRAEGEFVKARDAFRTGAQSGNLGSMSWLGTMMLWGQGGPVDVDNGMLWLTAAAGEGHLVAKGQLLILERQKSKSIFRHIIYHIKRILLALRAAKDYSSDPYSGKLF